MFVGYGDGDGNSLDLWGPTDDILLKDACTAIYRLMTDDHGFGSTPVGTEVGDHFYAQFFVSNGILRNEEFDQSDDSLPTDEGGASNHFADL